jgi:hypothetical protein
MTLAKAAGGMARLRLLLAIGGFIAGSGAALADDNPLEHSLTFTLQQNYIMAEGVFEADSSAQFDQFLANNGHADGVWNIPLFIHSGGGDLGQALIIGYTLRGHAMSTVAFDFCASACTYMMMGGVNRVVAKNTQYGVHQFYSEKALATPDTPFFSAQEVSQQQNLLASLHDYADEMGVKPRIVDIASHTAPSGATWLSHQQLVDLGVDNVPSTDPEGQSAEAIAIPGVTDGAVTDQSDAAFLESLKIPEDSPPVKLVGIASYNAKALARRVIMAETLALPDLEASLTNAYGMRVRTLNGVVDEAVVVAEKRRMAQSWGVRRRTIEENSVVADCDSVGISCTVTGIFSSELGLDENSFIATSHWRFTCEVMLPLTLPRVTSETLEQVE